MSEDPIIFGTGGEFTADLEEVFYQPTNFNTISWVDASNPTEWKPFYKGEPPIKKKEGKFLGNIEK